MIGKKIYINKDDEVAAVLAKLASASAVDISVSLPKFAKFSEDEANFGLLKKRAEALKKKIIIESVDDAALELAERQGLTASNPFFAKPDGKLMDIVPAAKRRGRQVDGAAPRWGVGDHSVRASAEKTLSMYASVKKKFGDDAVRRGLPQEEALEESVEARMARADFKLPRVEPPAEVEAARELEKEFGPVESLPPSVRPSSRGPMLVIMALLVVSGFLSYAAFWVLPRAEIKILSERKQYTADISLTIDKALSSADQARLAIPGQIFSERRNATLSFPASGRKQIAEKAAGKIIIYNAYSSSKQVLVATTRFITPEGVIFRLVKNVTVPGALIENGKIVPSSTEAEVIADAAGEASNVGPVARWSVPGFKGTPRYEGFYGESKEPMVGGYKGEVAYPSTADIQKAKEELAKTLENSARAALSQKVPPDFRAVVEEARFAMIKQTVNADRNPQATFSIYGEGEASLMAFREADVSMIIKGKISQDLGADYEIKSQSLAYGKPSVNWAVGVASLLVSITAEAARIVAVEGLRGQVAGKSELELKALLLSLSGLESAKVSLWPFWVRSVPKAADKINIIIE